MRQGFRASMDWVHTWSGVICGVIMFVIFFMGTLSVFKDETDQWLLPQARHVGAPPDVSLDLMYDAALGITGLHPHFIVLSAPTERAPIPTVTVAPAEGRTWIYFLDPQTYEVIAPIDSAAASQFFYPMHYRLHVPGGRWIVGAVSMFLLLALISGIVIHRKIFVDFFTYRRGKKLPRLSLDLHNLTSVLALPFHLAITITGILIFASFYLQPSLSALYPGEEETRARLSEEAFGYTSRETSGETNLRVSSIDAMLIRAQPYWDGEPLSDVFLDHPHDEDGTVRLRRLGKGMVADERAPVLFDADAGQIVGEPGVTSAGTVQSFIVGMHEIHFDHFLLRWLYFFGGVAGSVMIATGYIYWLGTRRLKHARGAQNGVPVVEALTIGGVMGLLTATAAYFVVNQLLPRGDWQFLGIERIFLEIVIFYLVWLAALAHGAFRRRKAWFDQAVLLAVLCALAPLLNWIVTGDHLLRTIWNGQWAIAVIDLVLLCIAATAAYGARRLQINWAAEVQGGKRTVVVTPSRKSGQEPIAVTGE